MGHFDPLEQGGGLGITLTDVYAVLPQWISEIPFDFIQSSNYDGTVTSPGFRIDTDGSAYFGSGFYAESGTLGDLILEGSLTMDTNGVIYTDDVVPYIRIANAVSGTHSAGAVIEFVRSLSDYMPAHVWANDTYMGMEGRQVTAIANGSIGLGGNGTSVPRGFFGNKLAFATDQAGMSVWNHGDGLAFDWYVGGNYTATALGAGTAAYAFESAGDATGSCSTLTLPPQRTTPSGR